MHNFDKSFKNYYCEFLACSIGEFIELFYEYNQDEILSKLSYDELQILSDYAVLKNRLAGVGELYLKVPIPSIAIKSLEKYGLKGSEILSARLLAGLKTSDLLGGRIILCIEDILDYNEGMLSEISDFAAKTDLPILIFLGRTLEEVGRVVNKFGKSPVEVLEDFGFLDRKVFVYGLNFIDKEDQKLLADYQASIILSPRSDAEEGKGAINLYNFIYSRLKFVFSSGKCYNINMLGEAKLAILNTNNLMYERGLVKPSDLLNSLFKADKLPNFDGENHTFLDEKFELNRPEQELLEGELLNLRKEVEKIALKIKEKL